MGSLKDRLKQVSGKNESTPPQKAAVAKNKTTDKSSAHYRPSRAGKKAVTGYFDPAVSKQIRTLALNEDTSVEALVGEALDKLFESRGLPQIAGKAPE